MKYWKGKPGTPKAGQIGTMDDNGNVPDSEPATQAEYEAAHPPTTNPDYVALYAAAVTDGQKIAVLAKALRLIP